jgi:leucyl aminopeptidase
LNENKVRNATAETCRWLRRKGISNVASIAQGAGINGISTESSAQAVTEGALLGLYAFRRYLTKKENNFGEIKKLIINGSRKDRPRLEQGINKGRIMAESANWARDLVNEPSNYMTPERMAETARQLAGESRIKVEVIEREQMITEGMGGLLGVSQGSQQPPKLIILTYRGKETDDINLALVGKGITFDSGGISIKPSEAMSEMKGDMAGGASVMAALRAIDRFDAKINVIGIVPATENMPSGTAMKPGDIITAMNGETIEVLNTDAEGRLILADALCYAKKLGAKSIVDIATLTGACHVALGDICTGAFTNNQRLLDKLITAGKEVGEYAWELPMYEEYREALKSDIADIKNIGNRYGGAITGAKFLADFVEKTPWVHLDIAGTFETKSDKGYLVKGATGVPVRTLVNLVLSLVEK